MRSIELLAPARNADIGISAINYGADAVYIGAPKFSARAAAGVSVSDIARLIKYAHQYNAKVYVALNTLLYDKELEQALDIINQVYEEGADAIIFQDLGLLNLPLPPIALHASTQVNNFNLEKIKFLDDLGIKRIVLARELTISEIKTIRQSINAEIEVFVHGALCVSLSGSCFFSEKITGRSANRGECSQPCRMFYSVYDEQGKQIAHNKHVLSLRDLNQSESISALIESGTNSLKIEGRMKDDTYVKNIVANYRRSIDQYLEKNETHTKASSGKCSFSFTPTPDKTFSRGFTDYFLNGRKKHQSSWDTAASIGEFIGTVTKQEVKRFSLNTTFEIRAGDGLVFLNHEEDLCGLRVNKFANGYIEIFEGITPAIGTKIYRNLDKAFNDRMDTDKSERKIEVNLTATLTKDAIQIDASDEDNNKSQLIIQNTFEIANNKEKSIDTIKSQLKKSGGTAFSIASIQLNEECDEFPFIPIAIINEWRRELLENLMHKRLNRYETIKQAKINDLAIYPQQKIIDTRTIRNKSAEAFYKKHGVTEFESIENTENSFLMLNRYCIRFETGNCKGKNENINAPDWLMRDNNRDYILKFNCNDCMMSVFLKSAE